MSEEEKALTDEILSDARKRADRTLKRAERQAARIIAEAERQAEAERGRILDAARRTAGREARVAAARMDQDAAALQRDMRQEVIEGVREEARRELARLAGADDYEGLLLALALPALEAMSGHEFDLVLRAADRRRLGSRLARRIAAAARSQMDRKVRVNLADETLETCGGLVLRGAGGHEVADQTFEARLQRLWDQLRGAVADALPDDLMGTAE